jgi:hypothetical protein
MPRLYASRVPFNSALELPGRAANPILAIFFFIAAVVWGIILAAVGLVVLVIDILLLPFRLLFGAR